MCSAWRLALVAAVTVGAPASGSGQQTAEALLDSLQRELDALSAPLEGARARADLEAATLEAARDAFVRTELDTVRVGPLRILTPPDRAGDADRMFAAVWSEVAPSLGASADVGGALFLFDPSDEVEGRLPGGIRRVTARSWRGAGYGRGSLRRSLWINVDRALAASYPSELSHWTGGFGPLREPPDDRRELYRRFALVSSSLTRGCIDGDLDGCWAAFGVSDSDDPVAGWYEPEQVESARDGTPSGSWRNCYVRRHERSCDTVRRQPVVWISLIPAPAQVRADLVSFALEWGGEGALDRLLQHVPDAAVTWATLEVGDSLQTVPTERVMDPKIFGDGLRAGLAAASGLDPTELMRAWRAELLAGRPDVVEEGRTTRFHTMLWVLLFTTFAMRSTRWRLG